MSEATGPLGNWRARPAVPVAMLFILGIAGHGRLPATTWVWIVAAWGLLGMAILGRRRARLASAALAGAVALSGIAAGQMAGHHFDRAEIAAYSSDMPRLAEVELRIEHPPRLVATPSTLRQAAPPKQVTLAHVTAVRTRSGWTPADGRMLVQLIEPHPALSAGQRIRALGMLQRPAPAMNPGEFDWERYYREQRILSSFQISNAANVAIVEPGPPWWQWPVATLREQTRRLLAAGFTDRDALDHALLRALLLGDSDPELRDVQDDFKRSGTSHHLSISGLHVAVLGGFVLFVCRILRLSPRAGVWAMTGFVVLYGLVALPSPPVVRAVILCVLFGFGLAARRTVDSLQLLAVSVVLMLAYHPLDLFNPGFQLSFGTVLGLIIFSRSMMGYLIGTREPLALQSPDSTESALPMIARWLDGALLRAMAAGLVAWVVSMPLVALHFEQLNPWAVGSSLLMAPVVFVALVGGLLKVLLTLAWPGMAEIWASIAAMPVALMRQMVDWLAVMPGSAVPLPAPTWWHVAIFYALLVATLLPCSRLTLRWCQRAAPVAACASILILPFHLPLTTPPQRSGELRVTLLAVGAGQCAVVEPPSGRTVLIDAGSTSLDDLLVKCLGPYLRHRGKTEVDTILVSHANYDHFSAVAELTAAYDVREVLMAPQFRRHAAANPPAANLLAALDRLERPPREVTAGHRMPLGRESAIEVLWPPPELDVDPNNSSIVFHLRHGNQSILFTGDVQEFALRQLLKQPHDRLRADVLVAPHHGSREPSTLEFIRAVSPTVIVSSNDRSLSRKQRELDTLLAAPLNLPLYRTDACGAVTITLSREAGVSPKVVSFVARPIPAATP